MQEMASFLCGFLYLLCKITFQGREACHLGAVKNVDQVAQTPGKRRLRYSNFFMVPYAAMDISLGMLFFTTA